MQRGCDGKTLPTENRYLFADLQVSTSGEGDEAMSPSFTIRCVATEASSVLLEALIATLLPIDGRAKKAVF